MSFVLSQEQKSHLIQWRSTLDKKENQEWYSNVKQASIEFNAVLGEAKLETGGSLTPTQIDRLFKLMKRLSNNRALNKSLYEENSLTDFNNRLRTLFFDRGLSIAARINQFRDLKYVKEVTMSHFLSLKDPAQYPFVSAQIYRMLRLDPTQEADAETQALRENSIASMDQWHKTTIDYLADWVVFRSVKDELKLESYPQINRILWDAYENEGAVEPPRSRTRREENLYEPIKNELRHRAEGQEHYWVKVTANQNRTGEWTRPDIASVKVDWFDHLPQKYVQVTSYEVKKRDSYDLSSVYETSAHQRMVHRTFLVLEVADEDEAVEADVQAEAARLGVGIMKAYPNKTTGHIELETVLEPIVKSPEPSNLDEFIADFFEGDKEGLRKYKHAID